MPFCARNVDHAGELPRVHARRPDSDAWPARTPSLSASSVSSIGGAGSKPSIWERRHSPSSRFSEASIPSMICLRDRPLALTPGPIAPCTLVAMTTSLRRGEILERAADDLLARALRIDVGRVEKVDSALQRFPDEWPRRLLLQHPLAPFGRAVGHAAEADLRHLHARLAEPDHLHRITPFRLVAPIIRPFGGSSKEPGMRNKRL